MRLQRDFRVPCNLHVGHVIRNIGNEERSTHSRNLVKFTRDVFQPALPFTIQRVVIFLKIEFEGLHHPIISSLPTFWLRPRVSSCGLLFNSALATRSLRPMSKPAHCGPRMALPPLNVTRSYPMLV